MTTAIEKTRTLEECEASIERCLRSFWEMGEDYRYIRDNDLYKTTHSAWGSYCKERWGLVHETVNNVIRATEIRSRLALKSENPGSLPVTEKQIRPLSTLPDDEQADAWQEAIEVAKAEGKAAPTHVIVDKVVKGRKAEKAPKRPPTPEELAHQAGKRMIEAANAFVRSVELLWDHLPNMADHEAQGCAYKIVETVNAIMVEMESRGVVTPDVVRGVMGVSNPEDGMVEVVT